jgi:MFS transporter, putative metabolite:H+ symporter
VHIWQLYFKKMHKPRNIAMLIIVASLGYFVDIYDLILFNIIKKESMEGLGIAQDHEVTLFNFQMTGMLIGGLLWGIWGDKKGRVSVLFGSILLYSIANICNAFATGLYSYAILRFIAGIGLAGELGAAITLVAESMPQKKRGIGTMIIVTFGAMGAVVAFVVSEQGHKIAPVFEAIFGTTLANWQTAYIIGGVLGLVLLALRAGTFESKMFHSAKESEVKRGDFFMLFREKETLKKYLACIVIGLPVWFVVGVLIALAHKFLPEIGVLGGKTIPTKELIMWSYIGLSSGDLLSGLLSQLFHSRRKVIFINLFGIAMLSSFYLLSHDVSIGYLKGIAYLLGLTTGYWALFVTNASEQFGTNIRATVTATVPNFVRGGVVPITLCFTWLADMKLSAHPYSTAAFIVGGVCLLLAAWGTYTVKESFHKDLNYLEES